MDKSIKIASVQMHVSNDNEKNLQTMEDCLKHIDNLFKDVDLVVFPELCSMSLDQNMERQAEEIPGLISNLFSNSNKVLPGNPTICFPSSIIWISSINIVLTTKIGRS